MKVIHIDLKKEIENLQDSDIKEIALSLIEELNRGIISEELIKDKIKRKIDDLVRR